MIKLAVKNTLIVLGNNSGLAKEHRRHIHQSINGLGLPVTHRTLREGSPHKLILTKTEQLFKANHGKCICTITGFGYQWDEEVMTEA